MVLFSALAVFSGCGEAEDSGAAQVDITAFPGAVIDGDYSIGTGDDQISVDGTSFNVQFTGVNNSEKDLFIYSLSGELRGDDNYTWAINKPEGALIVGYAPKGSSIVWMVNESLGGGALILSSFVEGLPETLNTFRVTFTLAGYFSEDDDPDTTVNEALLPSENFKKTITVNVKR